MASAFTAPVNTTKNFTLKNILTHVGVKSGVTDVPGNDTAGSNLETWIKQDYLKVLYTYTVQGGIKNPYFEPTIAANGTITFKQKVAKTVDHEENLVIGVVDCHNNKTEITVPVRVVSSYNTTESANGVNISENSWSIND